MFYNYKYSSKSANRKLKNICRIAIPTADMSWNSVNLNKQAVSMATTMWVTSLAAILVELCTAVNIYGRAQLLNKPYAPEEVHNMNYS